MERVIGAVCARYGTNVGYPRRITARERSSAHRAHTWLKFADRVQTALHFEGFLHAAAGLLHPWERFLSFFSPLSCYYAAACASALKHSPYVLAEL